MKFGAFRMEAYARENTSSFFNLQSMLLIEESHEGASTSTHANKRWLIGPMVMVHKAS